jgi:hypothetical protein
MAAAKESVIQAPNSERSASANRLDVEIRREWQKSQTSLLKVSGMLATMRNEKLWIELINPETKDAYKRFSDYVCEVTGNKIAHTKLYELLAIYGLTQGEDALDPKDVDEMGAKNAAEIARLDPKDRTPEVVESAKKESTRKLKKLVQEKLNEKLDPEDRKEPTFMLGRNLDEPTIELIEQIEQDGIWIEAVRNGDNSVSQLVKLWNYVWSMFVLDHQEEIAEGQKYREAMEAAKVAEVAGDESDDLPPAPEEHLLEMADNE